MVVNNKPFLTIDINTTSVIVDLKLLKGTWSEKVLVERIQDRRLSR